MPFVGIIAKECDSNFIKNEVKKNAKKNTFEMFNINQKNIENIKNITFETIVINDDILKLLETSKYLEEILKRAKFLIINTDVVTDLGFLKEYKSNIITYGLNNKAIVTISSVKEDDILICIQKSIKGANKKNIEVQEINIKIVKNNLKKLCNSLAIFTILRIYGEFLKKI